MWSRNGAKEKGKHFGRRGRDSTRKGVLTKPGRVCCSEQCGEAEPDSLNAVVGLLGHSGPGLVIVSLTPPVTATLFPHSYGQYQGTLELIHLQRFISTQESWFVIHYIQMVTIF